MDADEPLANPRHETYCHERVASRTQRQAKLAAWPERSRWKPETVDNKICKLEAEQEDKARIARLKRLAAEKAATTRAEAPAAMSETFQTGIERERGAGDGKPMNYTAGSASRSWARPCSTRYPKSGRPRPSGPSAGTQGRRDAAVNLPRRRAHRHSPVAAALCQGLLLDGPRAHAGDLRRAEWDDARIRARARRIGPSCVAVVDRIFDWAKIKEQANDPALSVLNCRGGTATSGSRPRALRNAGIWPQEHLGDRADHAGGLVAGEHAYAAKPSWLAIELAYADSW